MSTACGIIRCSDGFKVDIYNIETKQKVDCPQPGDKSINEIVEELLGEYGNDIGKIVVFESSLEPDQLEDFRREILEKYSNILHLATKEELDFHFYLTSKVEYSVQEWIILLKTDNSTLLYEVTKSTGEVVEWALLDTRYHTFTGCVDFQYVEKIFRLKANSVHVIFEDSQENIESLYGTELRKYNFKSINFGHAADYQLTHTELVLARYLVPDPEVLILVKTHIPKQVDIPQTFCIHDWGFIHVPKLVKEYESRTDIMGIDLGATTSVLAVSRERGIDIVPFDDSSLEDLWTESFVSFDEEKPIIGRAAVERLRTKPDHVIFDVKLLCNRGHRWNKSKQLTWPFNYTFKQGEQMQLEVLTSEGLKEFSFAEINKIFMERMTKAASEYQREFNNGESVKKAVITVPDYFWSAWTPITMISNVINAAKLANIEVIDIIEETHADLLYYLSNEKYSELIKDKKKIAIFDIGGGDCSGRIYEISQHDNNKYGTCVGDLFMSNILKGSGRDIDEIIMEELEKSIPEDLRNKVKLKTLEAAKKIKHELSVEKKTKFNLSEIHSRLEELIEFTRNWFEQKLESRFEFRGSDYCSFKIYSIATQKELRCERESNLLYSSSNDVDIVFLAGGTCRIPFVRKWIGAQFPNANIVIDEQLEIITATGAAIHALQVLSGEVEPYIKINEESSILNENAMTDQNKVNTFHQLEPAKDGEIEVDIHKVSSQPQSEAELRTKVIEKEDGNPSNFSSSNKGAAVEDSQTVDNPERRRHHSKTDLEFTQEGPAKKELLP